MSLKLAACFITQQELMVQSDPIFKSDVLSTHDVNSSSAVKDYTLAYMCAGRSRRLKQVF